MKSSTLSTTVKYWWIEVMEQKRKWDPQQEANHDYCHFVKPFLTVINVMVFSPIFLFIN